MARDTNSQAHSLMIIVRSIEYSRGGLNFRVYFWFIKVVVCDVMILGEIGYSTSSLHFSHNNWPLKGGRYEKG